MSTCSLPSAAIDRVRAIPGNEVCVDCGASEPDWGDVLHGSLHCIHCAGQHRALGVSISFCRSLTMDNWTEANLVAMLLGGNRQLKSFFERQEIENSAIDVLYRTKQAAYYREQLSAQVDQTLAKRRRTSPAKKAPARGVVETERAEDFDVEVSTAKLGASLTRALPPPSVPRAETKSGNGSWALVTQVKSEGVAWAAGMRVGDYVVALNGRAVADYDEFVSLFPRCPRPVRLTVRRFRTLREPEQAPEEDDYSVAFEDDPMGFSIERKDGVAAVSKIAPGGRAASMGVRVGDLLVGLANRHTPTYDVVIHTLPLLPRPLIVKFKRGATTPARPPVVPFRARALPPATAGGYGQSFRQATTTLTVHTDKGELGDFEDDREFDVQFDDGPLGMRIEERGANLAITVVTHCDRDGQAYEAGVRLGSVVIGINGHKFLSHAHTAATLRHAKRPVSVRFRLSD